MESELVRRDWLIRVVSACQRAANSLAFASPLDRESLIGTFAATLPPAATAVEALILHGVIADVRLKASYTSVVIPASGKSERAHHVHNARIAMAVGYLACNLRRDNLSEYVVAHHVGLSRAHFSRLFTRETGLTFREYLKLLRIRTAVDLMSSRELCLQRRASGAGHARTVAG